MEPNYFVTRAGHGSLKNAEFQSDDKNECISAAIELSNQKRRSYIVMKNNQFF